MKANFKKINVEVAFDEFQELDIAKQIGNFIHVNTPDIGLDDVAREIYHSKGDIEIPEEYIPMILDLIKNNQCPLVAAVKKAIINALTKE